MKLFFIKGRGFQKADHALRLSMFQSLLENSLNNLIIGQSWRVQAAGADDLVGLIQMKLSGLITATGKSLPPLLLMEGKTWMALLFSALREHCISINIALKWLFLSFFFSLIYPLVLNWLIFIKILHTFRITIIGKKEHRGNKKWAGGKGMTFYHVCDFFLFDIHLHAFLLERKLSRKHWWRSRSEVKRQLKKQ